MPHQSLLGVSDIVGRGEGQRTPPDHAILGVSIPSLQLSRFIAELCLYGNWSRLAAFWDIFVKRNCLWCFGGSGGRRSGTGTGAMWTVACEDSIHASGKIRVRWSAPAGSAERSARKDFVALFKLGEESLRKYDQYKVTPCAPPRRSAKRGSKNLLADPHNAGSQVIAKEGLQNGEVRSPPQPNLLLQQAHRNPLRPPHAPSPSP